MLPPKSPGHRPSQTCSPAGATATRPSMGRSGSSMRLLADAGMSRMPVIRARSIRQTKRRGGSGSLSIRVRLSAATPLMPFGLHVGDRDVAIRRQLHDANDQRVARRGAFDGERTDFSRPGTGNLGVVVVARTGKRLGLDGVSGLDRQDRRPHRERGHACGRLVLVGLGRSGGSDEQEAGDGRDAHRPILTDRSGSRPLRFSQGAGRIGFETPEPPESRSPGRQPPSGSSRPRRWCRAPGLHPEQKAGDESRRPTLAASGEHAEPRSPSACAGAPGGARASEWPRVQPDADFGPTPGSGIRGHAVEAKGCQQQRQPAKEPTGWPAAAPASGRRRRPARAADTRTTAGGSPSSAHRHIGRQ